MSKKYYCPVCGYESDTPIDVCPICGAKMAVRENEERTWAAEHQVGIIDGVDEEIVQGLRDNFNGECSEVGMYLAMARVAHREGYPEIGLYWEKAAYEEAEHAAKFAEMLGEVVTPLPRRTWRCVWLPRTALPWASLSWLRRPRLPTWMRFMTPCTRWLAMKPATAKPLKAC